MMLKVCILVASIACAFGSSVAGRTDEQITQAESLREQLCASSDQETQLSYFDQIHEILELPTRAEMDQYLTDRGLNVPDSEEIQRIMQTVCDTDVINMMAAAGVSVGMMGGMSGGSSGMMPPMNGMSGGFSGMMPPMGGMSGGFSGMMQPMGGMSGGNGGMMPPMGGMSGGNGGMMPPMGGMSGGYGGMMPQGDLTPEQQEQLEQLQQQFMEIFNGNTQ